MLYRDYGQLPAVTPFTYGIKPAIIAIILAAVFPLAKKSLKSAELGLVGLLAIIISLAGINEIIVMFGAGFLVLLLSIIRKPASEIKNYLPVIFLNMPLFSHPNMKIF